MPTLPDAFTTAMLLSPETAHPDPCDHGCAALNAKVYALANSTPVTGEPSDAGPTSAVCEKGLFFSAREEESESEESPETDM
jgi:hypothetical protein